MVTISLAISHTPWVPERVESMARLRKQLGIAPEDTERPKFQPFANLYLEMTDRAPNAVWSEKMWWWAVDTGADWCLFLQDDVEVAPNFWPALRAMLQALGPASDIGPRPVDVMCLEVAQPAAQALYDDGARWLTTSDALIGVGYVIRRKALAEFLEWRASKLKPGALDKGGLTEDTMLGIWCLVTGRRIWGPLPTIIDHDTTIASTYGNDQHTNRRPLVRWDTVGPHDLESKATWTEGPVRHIGRFYEASPYLAMRWVEGLTEADFVRFKADDGSPVLTGLRYRMLAKAYKEPKYKVFLGTPHTGAGVHPAYAMSVFQLQKLLGIDLFHEMSLNLRQEQQDLVRVRSRMLRIAYESDCTHLLLADGDNAWPPEVVAAMLRTGKDFVQAPYLRRDGRGYTIRPTKKDRDAGFTADEDIQADNTIEIEHTGLGLTLISRECMATMLEHYSGGALDYFEPHEGKLTKTTALFMLMIRGCVLLGEDTSFATRWRDIGGKVWLYIGDGSPIAHYGEHLYQGRIEDFGFKRSQGVAT